MKIIKKFKYFKNIFKTQKQTNEYNIILPRPHHHKKRFESF